MLQNPNFTTFSDKATPEQMSNPGGVRFMDPETGATGTLEQIRQQNRLQKVARRVVRTGFGQKYGEERDLPEGLSYSA